MRKNRLGKANSNWKGGVEQDHRRLRTSDIYISWRNSVFIRDKYTCQDCGVIGGELHAHHILSFSNHPALRLDLNNGTTLCIDCHAKIHPMLKKKNEKV